MTQVIGVVTHRSVLLAADRRLISIATGDVIHDDTCKMVSLCNTAGIAYTGLAAIDSTPTHEWICHKLADANVVRAAQAVSTLADAATRSFNRLSAKDLYPHTFLLAGYEAFVVRGIKPMLAIITNMRSEDGAPCKRPSRAFRTFRYVKPDAHRIYSTAVGAMLPDARHTVLVRNMRRAFTRGASDETLLRLMAETIVDTSRRPTHSVGERVLTMAIPVQSLLAQKSHSFLLAGPADQHSATFGSLVPDVSRMVQYGPSFVCAGSAFTNVTTVDDPSRNYQSSEIRILRLPSAPPKSTAAV